jgi:hypothetical protein
VVCDGGLNNGGNENAEAQTVLADNSLVPEYVEQLPLPIRTHRPSGYAVVDLRTGQIWIASQENPAIPVPASPVVVNLLKKLLNRRGS